MIWIEGITRNAAGFFLATIDHNGTRLDQPLSVLAEEIPGDTTRARITTDFANWKLSSAEPFIDFLRIQPGQIENKQTIFEVTHDDNRYLIPAAVLLASIMRPIQHVQDFLFRPQGLDLMCLPLLDSEKPTVGFNEPEHHLFGKTRRLSDGLLAGYSWMHCFPSARKMWDSVYASAQERRLNLDLPAATLTVVLHSIRHLGYHLVTSMTLMSISTDEAPYEFAANHAPNIYFHESANMDWASAHQPSCSLQSRNGEWSTNDDEWAVLSSMLHRRKGAKYELRNIIDLILTKIGTGKEWRKLAFGELNFNIVQFTYQQLQRSGRWANIEKLLNEMRKPATQKH